jgi:hypothetical protein
LEAERQKNALLLLEVEEKRALAMNETVRAERAQAVLAAERQRAEQAEAAFVAEKEGRLADLQHYLPRGQITMGSYRPWKVVVLRGSEEA